MTLRGVNPILSTLFTDPMHFDELETASALPQASEIRKQLVQKRVRSMQTHAIGFVHPSQGPGQMRALKGVLLLSVALIVLSSAARALELGP